MCVLRGPECGRASLWALSGTGLDRISTTGLRNPHTTARRMGRPHESSGPNTILRRVRSQHERLGIFIHLNCAGIRSHVRPCAQSSLSAVPSDRCLCGRLHEAGTRKPATAMPSLGEALAGLAHTPTTDQMAWGMIISAGMAGALLLAGVTAPYGRCPRAADAFFWGVGWGGMGMAGHRAARSWEQKLEPTALGFFNLHVCSLSWPWRAVG